MDYSNLSNYCIYTMRNSEELNYLFNSDRKGTFYENQLWKTGKVLFDDAHTQGLTMPILFSAADTNSGLIYYGTLTSIILFEIENKTKYYFENLTKITIPKPLSSLYLKSSKNPLSDSYIRPYAICLTPSYLEDCSKTTELLSLPKFRKSGKEPFHYNFKKLDFSLEQFWQWAYSDIIGNTVRGILAEYIVAKALDLTEKIRIEWDAFDLLTDKGLKIEVKSASYIQTWYQKKYSEISFSIRKTKYWDENTNIQAQESKRQADIYVFCLLKHKVQETLNPLDLNQWDFYILSSSVINKEMGDSKHITLKKLMSLAPVKSNFGNLKMNIE
ncbi:MAG: hypothetical protein K8R25_01850 [Methanosarcinales archaeon]|nr:hypothetical protein [Methanosarcinales archaeon]